MPLRCALVNDGSIFWLEGDIDNKGEKHTKKHTLKDTPPLTALYLRS